MFNHEIIDFNNFKSILWEKGYSFLCDVLCIKSLLR